MNLEDILAIDTSPFDETVLDECIAGEYNISSLLRIDLCNLILRYLKLFWEKYQSDLIRTHAPHRLVGAYDTEQEDYFLWDEEAADIMHTAVNLNGWKCICLCYDSGDIEIPGNSVNDEDAETEQFHKAYMKFLDACHVEGFARKFFENEENLMKDAICYTDSAYLGILLNEKLMKYNTLKKQHADMIQEVCKEEDLHISRLEHNIWMPFWVCFAEEKKECDGEEYGVFLLGSDGYNYYGFDRFDPNWVCKTFVMDQLLDIAIKKLEVYIAAKKTVA